MAKNKLEMDDLKMDDLDIGDIDFGMDPLKDTRHPITKITTSFGKSSASEFLSLSSLRRLVTMALPTEYGKAISTLSEVSTAAKKLYGTAATELRPLAPDIKKAVDKVLPTTSKFLPDSVQSKLDSFSKSPEPTTGSSQPSEEENQNTEVSSTLATIFGTKMQYDAQQDARKTAYGQIRDQVKDDQFRMGYSLNASVSAGMQRLVAYQDQVTSRYQRKSLELQYRQLYATRDLLRVTAMSADSTGKHLRAIMLNTALPDFAKSSEIGKVENTIAKRMAASMFPGAQKFLSQYFANFTNQVGDRIRTQLGGFIQGYQGLKDISEMTEGMDRSTMLGDMAGAHVGNWAREKTGAFMRKHLNTSRLVKHLGSKLSYKIGNLPGVLNRFAKDYSTDHTEKHGKVLGSLMNWAREFMPQVSGGGNVVGRSSLLRSDEAVPFNFATRQALTEVIPGFLSRIHHELVIMRSGDAASPRISYNAVKGKFTTNKVLAKDVAKHVYNKDEIELLHQRTANFVNELDPHHLLSDAARTAIHKKTIAESPEGADFSPETFMGGIPGASEAVSKEIRDHMRRTFRLREDGSTGKTSLYTKLNKAAQAHKEAVSSIPDIKERLSALHDAGLGEELHSLGFIKTNANGESEIDKEAQLRIMSKSGTAGKYKDVGASVNMGANRGFGVMEPGGSATHAAANAAALKSAEIMEGMKDRIEEFGKTTDELIKELHEGALVQESRRAVAHLETILKVLETRDFSHSNIDEMLRKAGGKYSQIKGRVVHMGEDGWAWIKDKAGKVHKVNVKDLAKQAKNKLTDAYDDLKENHGEYLTKAQRRAKFLALKAQRKSRHLGNRFTNAYHEYMNTPAEGIVGHTGHLIGAVGGVAGGLIGAGFTGAGHVARGLFGAARLSGEAGWWGAKKVVQGVGGVFTGANRARKWYFDDCVDVYVPRQKEPALYAKYMKMGRYYNVNPDGTPGKPVYTIKDIKGEVKDKQTGDVVLTAEEYVKGLYNSKMQLIGSKIGRGLKAVLGAIGSVITSPIKAVGIIKDGIVSAAKGIFRFATFDTDIYVGGDPIPRLTGKRMKLGYYVCETTKKVVHRAADIKGPVMDVEAKKYVIIQEDLERGIYNSLGHNLTRGIYAAWNAALSLAKLPFKLAKGAWNIGTGLLKGAGSFLMGGVNGLAARLHRGGAGFDDKKAITMLTLQLNMQRAIFNLLHERMKKPKGMRKNSWEEKFLKEHNAEEAKAHAVAGGGVGTLGKLKGWFKNKFGKKDADQRDGDDTTGQDVKDDYKSIKGIKNKYKNFKRLRQLRKLKNAGTLGEEGAEELKTLEKSPGAIKKAASWGSKAWKAARGIKTAATVAEGAGTVAEVAGGAVTAGEAVAGAATVAAEVAGAATVAGGAAATAATVGTAAAATGGVLATIFSAPVLLVAGAIALVGLGAYYAWKTFKNRGPKDIINVRLAMYGIDKTNSREVQKVLELEDALSKNVSVGTTSASLSGTGLNPMKLMENFGVNIKHNGAVKAWWVWFNGRFKPVYLNTIKAVKDINSKIDMGEADRKLKPLDKMSVLKEMRKLNSAVYQVDANPFADQRKFFFFKVGKTEVGTHDVDTAFNEAFANVAEEIKKNPDAGSDQGKGMGAKDGKIVKGRSPSNPGEINGKGTGKKKSLLDKALALNLKILKLIPGVSGLLTIANAIKGPLLSVAGGLWKAVSDLLPKKFAPRDLSALQAVRMKAYGLTEMNHTKVGVLYELETAVLPMIAISGSGQAAFTGDVGKCFDTYCGRFGIVSTDAVMMKVWIDWFKGRFLPVLLQYATAIHQIAPNIKLDAVDGVLKPDQELYAAKAVLSAKTGKEFGNLAVWNVPSSPWASFSLNMDSKSTDGNIKYLDQQVEKMKVAQKTAAEAVRVQKAKAVAKKAGKSGDQTKPKYATPADRRAHALAGQAKLAFGGPSKSVKRSSVIGNTDFASTTNNNSSQIGKITGLPSGNGYTSSTHNHDDVGPAVRIDRKAAIAQLRASMTAAGITDPKAQANILANVQAESDFKPRYESLKYSAQRLCQIFPSHFSGLADAQACVMQGPEAVGNRIYGGRMGNGADEGYLYRGRGYIQLTGKSEYARMSKLVGVDLVTHPELAVNPDIAAKIAVAYMKDRMKISKMTDINAVVAAVGPANLHAEQIKRAGLASSFLNASSKNEVSKTPTQQAMYDKSVADNSKPSSKGMNQADSDAALSNMMDNATYTSKQVRGGPPAAGPMGTMAVQPPKSAPKEMNQADSDAAISKAMDNATYTSKRVPVDTVIASTPVPSIDRPMNSPYDNRMRMQKQADVSDDTRRRANDTSNDNVAKATDILAKSHETQLSMDDTLKKILIALAGGGKTQVAGVGSISPTGSSKQPGQMVADAPVDVSRKTG